MLHYVYETFNSKMAKVNWIMRLEEGTHCFCDMKVENKLSFFTGNQQVQISLSINNIYSISGGKNNIYGWLGKNNVKSKIMHYSLIYIFRLFY